MGEVIGQSVFLIPEKSKETLWSLRDVYWIS